MARLAQTLMVYGPPSDFRMAATKELSVIALAAERGPAGDRYQITVTLDSERVSPGPIKGSIVIETNDPSLPS